MKKIVYKYKTKKVILLLTIILLLLALSLARLARLRQLTSSKAQTVPASGPTLSLDLNTQLQPGVPVDIAAGANLDLQLKLNTSGTQVKALDFVLPYDPAILTFQNEQALDANIVLNPSSGFSQNLSIKKVDTVDNKVLLGLAVNTVNNSPLPVASTSDILLATVKFKIRPDAGVGSLQLVPDTTSTIYNLATRNVLGCVGGLNFNIVQTAGAGLSFSLRLPDVAASDIASENVMVELSDGANIVATTQTSLVRSGNYFQTPSSLSFNADQNRLYSIQVKTRTGLRRIFANVRLTPGSTLNCTVTSNSNCGELISKRDIKVLFSGDSDGFNTQSGSYNKVDSADLQVIALHFNQPATADASAADFNLDGQADISDLEIIGKNYGLQGD